MSIIDVSIDRAITKTLRKSRYAVVAMAAAMFVACAEEPFEVSVPDVETGKAENPDHEVIRSLGFSTEDIVETEDSYIIEGDMVLKKDALSGYAPQTRHAKYHKTLLINVANNIRVYLSPSLTPEWRQAALDAMSEWNGIPNCAIRFTTVNRRYQVFIGKDLSIPSGTVALAELPGSGMKPGGSVKMGSGFDGRSASFKKNAMVHELGHVLGLVHTNWADNGSTSGTHIAGTPDQNDINSVMNWRSRPEWTGFSRGDLAAAQVLYGAPVWSSSIAGSWVRWPVLPMPTYTLSLGTNLIDLNVSWYVNNVLEQSGPSFIYAPASLPAGRAVLKAVVGYGGRNYETDSYNITDAYPEITGVADPHSNTDYTYKLTGDLPAGVRFVDWAISPGSYTVTGAVTNPGNLTVSFSENVLYTLEANVGLPDGSTYTPVARIINLTSAVTPQTPSIHEGSDSTVMVSRPQAGVVFDWELNGSIAGVGSGSEFRIDDFDIEPAALRCRARNGEMVSNWSPYLYVYPDSPQDATGSLMKRKLLLLKKSLLKRISLSRNKSPR